MRPLIKVFYAAVLLGLCLKSIWGKVEVVSVNSENGKYRFLEGNSAFLVCTTSPSQGQMSWKVNNVTVAKCTNSYCTKVSTGSGKYEFGFDIESQRFEFTINPLAKEENGKVIECSDGVSSVRVTLEVHEAPVRADSQLGRDAIIVSVFALVLGVGLWIVTIVVYCTKKRITVGDCFWKRRKTEEV